jgi:DNA repair exonuclease SbcCD ATPase subunit
MKLPFQSNPAAARDRARAELATAKAQLAELQDQRAAALAGDAVIPEIRKIDRAAEEQRATISLLEDRIRRLNVAARQAAHAQLERERDDALARMQPALRNIEKLAAGVEEALAALAANFVELEAANRALSDEFPRAVPKPQFWTGMFSVTDVRSRIQQAMRHAQHGSIGRLVEFANLERDVSITESIKRQIEASLKELRTVPIVLSVSDEAADVAADVGPETRGLLALATS